MTRLRTEDLSWQEIDGEIVVLDLRASRYFHINGTGAVLWELITEQGTDEELADALTERFGVPLQRAKCDVDAFIRELDDHGLVAR